MQGYSFLNGAMYSRSDVLRVLGMNPPPKWGPYVNGYFERDGAHFIFCNVGVAGRTGHDYPNRFDGDDLVWTGKTGSKKAHVSIQRLTAHAAEVHIFFRENNLEAFTYLGLGRAKSVDNESPVGVRWSILALSGSQDLGEETVSEGASDGISRIEGEGSVITTTRFERNPVARARCIKHFGAHCQICGIDFAAAYGSWGTGFIHVHHHRPISEAGGSYVVDPIKDLIPVCPNCHAMLHRKREAISVEDLKAIREAARAH